MNRIFWIVFGLISVVCNVLFSYFPAIADKFYYRGVFQLIRVLYDYILGWIPFPMIYIVLPLTILLIYHLINKAINCLKSQTLGKASINIFLGFLAFASFYYSMFYWLWGFNYAKPNFESNIGLKVEQISTTQLFNQLHIVHGNLLELKKDLDTKPELLEARFDQGYEGKIRVSLEQFLEENEYPTNGRVRIRRLRPKGSLLRFSTAGVYIPFAIEGHIDAGMHPLIWPAVVAHEMAHGYGFTDEGTCNFIGYQVCIDHEDPYMQYSGWLMYFRYLYSNARRADRSKFKVFQKILSKQVYDDLIAIDEFSNRYPDIMPKVRDAVYDSYLKSHGIKEGLRSYSRMILLVNAWNKKLGKKFNLQEGDLLFQDSDCGEFCDAIEAVTDGVEGYNFSHIGLLMKDIKGELKVMEAISAGVVLTPIDSFMQRSLDSIGQSKIVVGRLKSDFKNYIPGAIDFIQSKMDAEYDSIFDLENDSYYCSELIHLAFKNAAGRPLFDTPPMTYIAPKSEKTFPIWIEYFNNLDTPIPEGKPGLNPASMSRSDYVKIIHRYF